MRRTYCDECGKDTGGFRAEVHLRKWMPDPDDDEHHAQDLCEECFGMLRADRKWPRED